MNKVLAGIDGPTYSQSVCEHAVWAARRLGAPLEFLHVLNRREEMPSRDLSGAIGLGAQESLLAELAALDEKRGKLAQQRGRVLLDAAVRYAREQGLERVDQRLRHGTVVETLVELEKDVRLFVLGKRGEHADFARMHLGSELERVIRAVQAPLLIASRQFKPIRRFLIAFDGGATTRKGVERVAGSALFKDLSCHIVMAGNETPDSQAQLQWARETLSARGFETQAFIRPGNAETVISEYVTANAIDLLVMGAYGHSRIRHLIVGSTTTAMIRTCLIPVLLVR